MPRNYVIKKRFLADTPVLIEVSSAVLKQDDDEICVIKSATT